MIEIIQHRLRVRAFKATEKEAEITRFAIGSYGFLLHGQPFCTSGTATFGQFADCIERHYAGNARTTAVVGVLRQLHDRNSLTH